MNLCPVVNLNRNIESSPALVPNDVCCASAVETSCNSRADNSISDDESINSIEITGHLRRETTSSAETREDSCSSASSQDIYDDGHERKSKGVKRLATTVPEPSIRSKTIQNDQQLIACTPLSATGGMKRKLVDYDDSESDADDCPTPPPPVQQAPRVKIEIKRPTNDLDLPIALRRSRRNRPAQSTDRSSTPSSTVPSTSQVRSS